jgi:hypothetical protein
MAPYDVLARVSQLSRYLFHYLRLACLGARTAACRICSLSPSQATVHPLLIRIPWGVPLGVPLHDGTTPDITEHKASHIKGHILCKLSFEGTVLAIPPFLSYCTLHRS